MQGVDASKRRLYDYPIARKATHTALNHDMIRLFSFLLSGCWHHWEPLEAANVYRAEEDGGKLSHKRYTQRCKHCGAIKVWNAK